MEMLFSGSSTGVVEEMILSDHGEDSDCATENSRASDKGGVISPTSSVKSGSTRNIRLSFFPTDKIDLNNIEHDNDFDGDTIPYNSVSSLLQPSNKNKVGQTLSKDTSPRKGPIVVENTEISKKRSPRWLRNTQFMGRYAETPDPDAVPPGFLAGTKDVYVAKSVTDRQISNSMVASPFPDRVYTLNRAGSKLTVARSVKKSALNYSAFQSKDERFLPSVAYRLSVSSAVVKETCSPNLGPGTYNCDRSSITANVYGIYRSHKKGKPYPPPRYQPGIERANWGVHGRFVALPLNPLMAETSLSLPLSYSPEAPPIASLSVGVGTDHHHRREEGRKGVWIGPQVYVPDVETLRHPFQPSADKWKGYVKSISGPTEANTKPRVYLKQRAAPAALEAAPSISTGTPSRECKDTAVVGVNGQVVVAGPAPKPGAFVSTIRPDSGGVAGHHMDLASRYSGAAASDVKVDRRMKKDLLVGGTRQQYSYQPSVDEQQDVGPGPWPATTITTSAATDRPASTTAKPRRAATPPTHRRLLWHDGYEDEDMSFGHRAMLRGHPQANPNPNSNSDLMPLPPAALPTTESCGDQPLESQNSKHPGDETDAAKEKPPPDLHRSDSAAAVPRVLAHKQKPTNTTPGGGGVAGSGVSSSSVPLSSGLPRARRGRGSGDFTPQSRPQLPGPPPPPRYAMKQQRGVPPGAYEPVPRGPSDQLYAVRPGTGTGGGALPPPVAATFYASHILPGPRSIAICSGSGGGVGSAPAGTSSSAVTGGSKTESGVATGFTNAGAPSTPQAPSGRQGGDATTDSTASGGKVDIKIPPQVATRAGAPVHSPALVPGVTDTTPTAPAGDNGRIGSRERTLALTSAIAVGGRSRTRGKRAAPAPATAGTGVVGAGGGQDHWTNWALEQSRGKHAAPSFYSHKYLPVSELAASAGAGEDEDRRRMVEEAVLITSGLKGHRKYGGRGNPRVFRQRQTVGKRATSSLPDSVSATSPTSSYAPTPPPPTSSRLRPKYGRMRRPGSGVRLMALPPHLQKMQVRVSRRSPLSMVQLQHQNQYQYQHKNQCQHRHHHRHQPTVTECDLQPPAPLLTADSRLQYQGVSNQTIPHPVVINKSLSGNRNANIAAQPITGGQGAARGHNTIYSGGAGGARKEESRAWIGSRGGRGEPPLGGAGLLTGIRLLQPPSIPQSQYSTKVYLPLPPNASFTSPSPPTTALEQQQRRQQTATTTIKQSLGVVEPDQQQHQQRREGSSGEGENPALLLFPLPLPPALPPRRCDSMNNNLGTAGSGGEDHMGALGTSTALVVGAAAQGIAAALGSGSMSNALAVTASIVANAVSSVEELEKQQQGGGGGGEWRRGIAKSTPAKFRGEDSWKGELEWRGGWKE